MGSIHEHGQIERFSLVWSHIATLLQTLGSLIVKKEKRGESVRRVTAIDKEPADVCQLEKGRPIFGTPPDKQIADGAPGYLGSLGERLLENPSGSSHLFDVASHYGATLCGSFANQICFRSFCASQRLP